MSILIERLDMPNYCGNCLLSLKGKTEGYVVCNFYYQAGETPFREKRRDCPLIEIPTPHGDLIDIDVLKNQKKLTKDTVKIIDNIPIIIKAEE